VPSMMICSRDDGYYFAGVIIFSVASLSVVRFLIMTCLNVFN